MKRYIKLYALEIYTAISVICIAVALFVGELSVNQKILLAYAAVFVLHEWEEGRFPGDLADLIGKKLLHRELTEETKKGTRIPAGILLLAMLIVPFCFDEYAFLVLIPVCLGIFEGFAHIMFIIMLGIKKPYSPGMVTAEIELVMSIIVCIFFGISGFTSIGDYVLGFVLMFVCYFILQRSIFALLGIPYRELPKIAKRRIGEIKAERGQKRGDLV